MFNPFITQGQLQLMINQEITRAISQQTSLPNYSSYQHNNCSGASPILNAALAQIVAHAFKNY